MVLSLANLPSGDRLGAFKVIVPLVATTVSAAYLAAKMVNDYSYGKDVPTVAFKDGAKTHDMEYLTDPNAFLLRCEQEYGPVFNLHLFNQFFTVLSGPELARELFLREELDAAAYIEMVTGVRSYVKSMIKSNREDGSMVVHHIVRDYITPYLHLYTPRIVTNLQQQLDQQLGHCENKLIENPMQILQSMVACSMACVFMGEEIGRQPEVIQTFIQCTYDMAQVLGLGNGDASFWRSFLVRAKYTYASPMMKHIKVLVNAATPVILKRRQEEAEQGDAYVSPDDVLQRMLDNLDKYNFVDLEDLCGHLLIMILASVHTTSDSATNLMYYLANYPEHTQRLYEEMQEVLAEETRELEELANKGGNTDSAPRTIKLSDAMTPKAIKKMVHLDSFVREAFRYRADLIGISHLAQKNMTLSNGIRIPKGRTVTVNLRSTHNEEALQGPDPKEFRPWRFVGKGKSATKVGPDFLPFGMGKHGCPGRFIAVQELKTIICLMISRFSKFEIEDPSKIHSVLHSRQGMPPATGLYLTSRE